MEIKMKKAMMILAAMLSFSTLATSSENLVKTASKALPSVSQVKSKERDLSQKSAQGVKIERRKVDKVKRDSANNLVAKSAPKVREASPLTATNFHEFSVYDAWSSLDYDQDYDGYYSEFTVGFDVDFSEGYADVYAEMYLSRDGGPWVYFNTTDVFTIYNNDSDDYYSVSTRLNYNFPTGNYDVLIDIIEAGQSGIVATAGPLEFDGLYALPIEDSEHEVSSTDTQISYVASIISDDLDLDGFYTRLELEYDIDTLDSGRLVYAEIDLINVDTNHRVIRSTENFYLGNHTEFVELILDSGFTPGWYDIEIRIVDTATNEVIEFVAQDFSALVDVPLESQNYDHLPDNTGGEVVDEVVIIHESGGGSLTWGLIFLLTLVTFRKVIRN